jgi:F0F1-type ATP synthase assembly protein I
MDSDAKKMWAIAATTGAVGLEIAAAIGIGYFGGQYLDRKLGITPWLTWLGFGAGVGAAVKALVRVARNYQKSLDDENQSEKR